MALTSEDLVRLLGTRGAVVDVPPCYVLEQAAESRFKLYEPLASAWRSEGVELAPEVEARLRAVDERQRHYREALEALRGVRGFTYHKGWRLASLYPRGWVRPSNDADVEVADLAAAMDAWRVLDALGFDRLLFCSVSRGAGGVDLVLGLERASAHPHCRRAEVVEVSTCLLPGHAVRVASRRPPRGLGDSPLVRTALALLDEQFQRDVNGKDVLDGVVLLRSMSAAERGALHAAAHALGRRRQLARLLGAVAATGLVEVGQAAGAGAGDRLRDATRPAAEVLRAPRVALARYAQDRIVERQRPRLAPALEARLRRRMTYADAWEAGLWFWSLPGEPAAVATLPPGELLVDRRHAVLGTPHGPLPLVPWSDVTEDELAGRA